MTENPSVLSFGEILWDVFPHEKNIGGAPLNVSAHLARLGAAVTFVSAVGQDENGDSARAQLQRFGIDQSAVATVADLPTGYCTVTLQDGAPSYCLAKPVAYDRIPMPKLRHNSFDALYFGTLAARTADSERTLLELLRTCTAREIFFDVNLRAPHWTPALLQRLLPHATILKCSRDEVSALSGSEDPRECCLRMAGAYPQLRLCLVTLDADGALLYDARQKAFLSAPKPNPRGAVVSTVGGGDSFCAAFLCNYLRGEPLPVCLARAVELASYVVTRYGAVPD